MGAHDRNSSGALHSCRAPGVVSLGLHELDVVCKQCWWQFWLADGTSGLYQKTSSWTPRQMVNSSFSLRKPLGRKETQDVCSTDFMGASCFIPLCIQFSFDFNEI